MFAIPPFKDGDRVAFFGDSITRNGEAITRTAACYRRMFPERKVRFFNIGISGGRVPAAHLFFEDWIAPRHPTHVVLAFGVNDAGMAIVTGGTGDLEAERRKADDAVSRFESEYEPANGIVRLRNPLCRVNSTTTRSHSSIACRKGIGSATPPSIQRWLSNSTGGEISGRLAEAAPALKMSEHSPLRK